MSLPIAYPKEKALCPYSITLLSHHLTRPLWARPPVRGNIDHETRARVKANDRLSPLVYDENSIAEDVYLHLDSSVSSIFPTVNPFKDAEYIPDFGENLFGKRTSTA